MLRSFPLPVGIAVLSMCALGSHSKADDESDRKALIGSWVYQNREYVFKKDGKFDFFTTGELQSQSGEWKVTRGKLVLTYSSFASSRSVESTYTLGQDKFTLKKEPFYYNAKAKMEDVPYARRK